ncbi:hypothetical protein, partial [Streptomyces violaceus]|uniref:hypothetical protein n=1 Tax=Streptomyces violaceus TaxID=1936 RepID=UPI0031EE1CAD
RWQVSGLLTELHDRLPMRSGSRRAADRSDGGDRGLAVAAGGGKRAVHHVGLGGWWKKVAAVSGTWLWTRRGCCCWWCW